MKITRARKGHRISLSDSEFGALQLALRGGLQALPRRLSPDVPLGVRRALNKFRAADPFVVSVDRRSPADDGKDKA